jgi:hypothetical protein
MVAWPVGLPPTLDTRRPFTRADAVAAGLHPSVLRGSRFRRLFRGVYVEADVPLSPRVRALAGLALHPHDAFAGHQTNAQLRGLPVPWCDRVHVTVYEQEQRVQRHGLACHVACREVEVEEHDGVRVSKPLDMFIELAGVLSLVDLVVVGDAMVRQGLTTPEELVTFCAGTSRWHSRRARRGAAYVRSGVDSPMETRLRMLLVLAGLPEPSVDHRLLRSDGSVRRRFDLCYPLARLVVEYDGRQHAFDVEQWQRDLARREELDDEGWRILVVTARGIYTEPATTVVRVARALSLKGVRVAVHDGWRPHFPVR